MFRELPNILTISRILIIPIVVISFYIDDKILSHRLIAGLFLFASITDFFDGYLARAWSLQSKLGRFLDPIADKLLVGSVILMLVHFNRIDILPAIAIICREILVSGLREFLAEIQVSVPVSKLAKIKTAFQMTAIFLLLLGNKGTGLNFIDVIGRILIWMAAGFTIFTGYVYLKSGLKHMDEDRI
ncbi:MAG: CDP-diacylglycerol--glycerol-3-phosphate 3-phosphatidyltransferase [Alphaproteobacteria bacterium]